MGKRRRSRFASKGWWKYQLLRPWYAVVSVYRHFFPNETAEQKQWDAWTKDLEGIQNHIHGVFRHRLIFREISDMLRNHPTLATSTDAGYIYEWLRDMYGHYITMAVRRELDRHPDAPTLYSLLSQILRRPQVVSRARFLRHFTDTPLTRDLGIGHWDGLFTSVAGPGVYIDAETVKADIKELDRQARLVVLYANRIVAHRAPEQVRVTVRHVDSSLDIIEKMLQKYHLIFTGSTLLGAEPSIMANWQRAFRVPWIMN